MFDSVHFVVLDVMIEILEGLSTSNLDRKNIKFPFILFTFLYFCLSHYSPKSLYLTLALHDFIIGLVITTCCKNIFQEKARSPHDYIFHKISFLPLTYPLYIEEDGREEESDEKLIRILFEKSFGLHKSYLTTCDMV